MKVPSVFQEYLSHQDTNFLLQLRALLSRLEDSMHNDLTDMVVHLEQQGELLSRQSDIENLKYPRETVWSMLQMLQIELNKRKVTI